MFCAYIKYYSNVVKNSNRLINIYDKKIIETKKHKLSYKKSTKKHSSIKMHQKTLQRLQNAGGNLQISNLIIIEQIIDLNLMDSETNSIKPKYIKYDKSNPLNYCYTEIPINFDIHHIMIPFSGTVALNPNYTNNIIIDETKDFIIKCISHLLDDNARILYTISSYKNEYNFYNGDNTGEKVINTLFELQPEKYWKDRLDIYIENSVIKHFMETYAKTDKYFKPYIESLQTNIHKLLVLVPAVGKDIKTNILFPKSLLNKLQINIPYLTIFNKYNENRKPFYCCQWFLYFLETISKCGSNRLVQLSGTCYINVVLNSLILGEQMQFIALRQLYYKLYNLFVYKPRELDTFINYLETNLSSSTCIKDQKFYIYNYIFQLLVKKTKFDIKANNASRNNFIRKWKNTELDFDYKDDAEMFLLGYSNAVKTMKELYAKLFAKDPINVKLNKFILKDNIYKFPDSLSNTLDNFISIYLDMKKKAKDYIFEIPLSIGGKINDNSYNSYNLNDEYQLDSAIIAVENNESGHVILGFICNGVPKIFDSNGFLFTLDWITMLSTTEETIRETFKKHIKTTLYSESDFLNINLQLITYVNKSKITTNTQDIIDNINIIVNYSQNPNKDNIQKLLKDFNEKLNYQT